MTRKFKRSQFAKKRNLRAQLHRDLKQANYNEHGLNGPRAVARRLRRMGPPLSRIALDALRDHMIEDNCIHEVLVAGGTPDDLPRGFKGLPWREQ